MPQNTVGLLETNGRVLESYMVGLNHEFGGELLWRRYPTDQRGSYFRQFWDVSEYVLQPTEAQLLLTAWLTSSGHSSMEDIERGELVEIIRKDLATAAEAASTTDLQTGLAAGDVNALDEAKRATLTELAETVLVHEALAEQLKDIARTHQWDISPLGENDNRKQSGKEESLVLIVRGDLLKRYPNALIYAIGGRGNGPDELMPNLVEFGGKGGTPVFPIFRGSLGADLVFLGFPFDEAIARSGTDSFGIYTPGMFFVLEERISEARFGLDATESAEPPQRPWENLWWGHFDVAEGKFLDDSTAEPICNGETWNELTDAALRARITLQRPARLVIHADQMLPPAGN